MSVSLCDISISVITINYIIVFSTMETTSCLKLLINANKSVKYM